MAHTALTSRAIPRVLRGKDVSDLILQVLAHFYEMFLLHLNDGEFSDSLTMHQDWQDEISRFSVIKMKRHFCCQVRFRRGSG